MIDAQTLAERAESGELSALDRWFVSLLNDPRDLPFVHLVLGCAVVAVAGMGLFFVPAPWFWYAAALYGAVWALGYVDRFTLMLHCTSHRVLFDKRVGWLNYLIPWVLCPFFGQSPETYFSHHLGMHHPENNLAGDLSSTMRYRRDSLLHWLHYYLSFAFLGLVRLVRYHSRRGNKKLARRTLVGELSFMTLVALLCWIDWRATLVVWIVPFVAVRVLMMQGNWAQHAFVDAADPANPYRNSITCINTRYDRRCFNDGYHIYHHVRARHHWSDYPAEFERNRAVYGAQDAVVFDGIDFFAVWLLLMGGDYEKLARHFVRLPGAPERSEAQVVDLLRSRVRPIGP